MAVTVTLDFLKAQKPQGLASGLAMLTGSIAFDDSYPTGGEDISDISKHFKNCLRIICENSGGYMFEYDRTNDLLLVYVPFGAVAGSGTSGADNALFKSGDTPPVVEVNGSGTAFQVSGRQVLDTTDLSALTGVSFIAIGLI